MSKKTKIRLIIASSLILVGSIIFVLLMTNLNWDFTKISTYKFESNTHQITQTYTKIDISTNEADIEIVPSQNGQTYVICYEKTKIKHSVQVIDDTLAIRAVDSRQWYDYIGFSFVSPKITVYIPQGVYEDIVIKTDTGNVKIPQSYSFEKLDISVKTGNVTSLAQAKIVKIKSSTGNVQVENTQSTEFSVTTSTGDVSCKNASANNVTINTSTGNVKIENIIASAKLSVNTSTGNVGLTKCDGGEIYIKTSTGNVKGSLLSQKNFKAKSSTGSVSVPQSVDYAPICEITVSTGDIKITIE